MRPHQEETAQHEINAMLGNLRVADNSGKHLGDLRIGRATVEWRPTRARKSSAVQLKVEKLMELIAAHAV